MPADTTEAARLLAAAWRSNVRLKALPPSAAPSTLDEAHAIQRAMTDLLGQSVGGWKAGVTRPIRGAVFASRLLRSPARLRATGMLRRVVEGEVAFIFDRAMPPSPRDYSREEVAAHVSVCVAIEIVDSRFEDQAAQPELDRIADLFGNSALVYSTGVADWRGIDLSTIRVSLAIDGNTIVDRNGGHGSGDPLHACVLLVNGLRDSTGVAAGQVVTTGTYTGAPSMEIGSTAVVTFEGLGSAEVTFTR